MLVTPGAQGEAVMVYDNMAGSSTPVTAGPPSCYDAPTPASPSLSPAPVHTPRALISSLQGSLAQAASISLGGLRASAAEVEVSFGGQPSQGRSTHDNTPLTPGLVSPMLKGLDSDLQRNSSKARKRSKHAAAEAAAAAGAGVEGAGAEAGSGASSPGSYSTVTDDGLAGAGAMCEDDDNLPVPQLLVDASIDFQAAIPRSVARRRTRTLTQDVVPDAPVAAAADATPNGSAEGLNLVESLVAMNGLTPRSSIRALKGMTTSQAAAPSGAALQPQVAEEADKEGAVDGPELAEAMATPMEASAEAVQAAQQEAAEVEAQEEGAQDVGSPAVPASLALVMEAAATPAAEAQGNAAAGQVQPASPMSLAGQLPSQAVGSAADSPAMGLRDQQERSTPAGLSRRASMAARPGASPFKKTPAKRLDVGGDDQVVLDAAQQKAAVAAADQDAVQAADVDSPRQAEATAAVAEAMQQGLFFSGLRSRRSTKDAQQQQAAPAVAPTTSRRRWAVAVTGLLLLSSVAIFTAPATQQ